MKKYSIIVLVLTMLFIGCSNTPSNAQNLHPEKDSNINSEGVFLKNPEPNSSEQKEETNLENLLRSPEKWPCGAVPPGVSDAVSNELPGLKDGRSYSAEGLSEFMGDIWVPWTKNHSDLFMLSN